MEKNISWMSEKFLEGIRLEYRKDVSRKESAQHYPHTHEFCELYFYLGGDCSYMVENGLYDVAAGTVIFTRPGELHSVRIDEQCTYERCYYQIHPHALDFLGAEAARSALRCFYNRPLGVGNSAVLPADVMERCHGRLFHSMGLLQAHSADARSLALADLLSILNEVNTVCDNSLDAHVHVQNGLIDAALRYINTHLAELSSTDELAAKLYVSREYLSRSFSRVMGIPLKRYITIKRVELAKVMLQDGCALDVVCERCGWTDYSYFIRVFRRETGMTPMRYRRSFGGQMSVFEEDQTDGALRGKIT